MQSASLQGIKTLEDKLTKALKEAWSKANAALAEGDQSPDSEMTIRLAAEAVEYSSAMFSLTYGLEDFDPAIKLDKDSDPMTLVRDAVREFQRAQELRETSTKEAYASLRAAADHLKLAYLRYVKKSARKSS